MSRQHQMWGLACAVALVHGMDMSVAEAAGVSTQLISSPRSGLQLQNWDGVTRYTLQLAVFHHKKDAMAYQRQVSRFISTPVYVSYLSASETYAVVAGPISNLNMLHRVSQQALLTKPVAATVATQPPAQHKMSVLSKLFQPLVYPRQKETVVVHREPVKVVARPMHRVSVPAVTKTAEHAKKSLWMPVHLTSVQKSSMPAAKTTAVPAVTKTAEGSKKSLWMPMHLTSVQKATVVVKGPVRVKCKYHPVEVMPAKRTPPLTPIRSGPYLGASTGPIINTSGAPSTYGGWTGTLFAGAGGYIMPRFYFGAEVYGANSVKIKNVYLPQSPGTDALSGASYGAAAMPGVLINDTSLLYFRVGGTRTYFQIPQSKLFGSFTRNGWQFGAGVDNKIAKNLELRLDYMFTPYNDIAAPISTNDQVATLTTTRLRMYGNQVNVGLVYKLYD